MEAKMDQGEIWYLGFVLTGFISFMVVLATVASRNK
jgi:hypothetical protein